MSVKEHRIQTNTTFDFVLEYLKFAVKLLYIVFRDSISAVLPKEKKNLVGEVVLITGGGHGIGRQVAINMAELGAEIVLWDINEKGVKQVSDEITKKGGKSFWYLCDVTSEKDVMRTAETVRQDVGEVTILINNAGIMQNVPMLELESVRIRQTMEVNVLAHFWTIRAFLPNMEKHNRGHIVAVASAAGLVGHVNQIDYSASKFAVVGLMEAFSEELRRKNSNIKLTTICPLTVDTGLNQNPITRCSWMMPIVTIEEAAKSMVNAIRREDFIVSIPRPTLWSLRIARLFPREVLAEVKDFTEYCNVPNTDSSKLPPLIHKKYT